MSRLTRWLARYREPGYLHTTSTTVWACCGVRSDQGHRGTCDNSLMRSGGLGSDAPTRDEITFGDRPPVVLVDLAVLDTWREDAPTMGDLGYRRVGNVDTYRSPSWERRTAVFVRPLWLWALHVVGRRLHTLKLRALELDAEWIELLDRLLERYARPPLRSLRRWRRGTR